MKKLIISNLLTLALTILLFSGVVGIPKFQPLPITNAQVTTAKSDLISAYRANVGKFIDWKSENEALRQRYDALGFTWANGDFTGSNSGITSSQFTTMVTNTTNIVLAYKNGATLSAGLPATIEVVR